MLVLAAADGVRLYERQHEDFAFEQGEELAWSDLQDDALLRLRRLLLPRHR